MKLVDLSVLNKLIDELNVQASSAVRAVNSKDALEYVVELSKMQGILSMIHHESNLLSAEIVKAYGLSSAEAMNLTPSQTKTNPGVKSLIDILPSSIKEPTKKN